MKGMGRNEQGALMSGTSGACMTQTRTEKNYVLTFPMETSGS